MRKPIFAATAASFIIASSTITAMAHVSLQQKEASPGSYKAVLGVPHGCDGQATEAVRVEIPEGFVGVKPMPKPGWTVEIEEGDYAGSYRLHGKDVSSGPVAVTWRGGSLADSHYDEFTLRGTLAGVEAGQRLFFKTTQTCASGEAAWVDMSEPGQDAHALDHPAPMLTIAAADGATAGHHHHGSGDVAVGDIHITEAWARAMLPGQPTGGAYMTVGNGGDEADTLVAATSPIAGKVEIHTMEMVDDVMVMRPLEGGLEVPAGGSVELKPGGMHVMFMQVKEPFAEGGEVPVTLEFTKSGKVDLMLPVRSARTGRGEHEHQH